MAEDFFLSRWSRLKARSRQGEPAEPAPPAAPPAAAGAAAAPAEAPPAAPAPLPDVATLTPESDFTPFMRGEVDPDLRQQALRTLFRDPRFNVMDGLDVYIDDYSKPDPIPAAWLTQLNQLARLGDYQEPEPEPESEAGEGAAAPEVEADDEALVQLSGPVDADPSDTSNAGDVPPQVDDSSRSEGGS